MKPEYISVTCNICKQPRTLKKPYGGVATSCVKCNKARLHAIKSMASRCQDCGVPITNGTNRAPNGKMLCIPCERTYPMSRHYGANKQ